MNYQDYIIAHYEKVWKSTCQIYLWDKGPFEQMPFDFRILEFKPNDFRNMWTYATCCMSQEGDFQPIELHLFSERRDETIIELLTAISYYHINNSKLSLWHTVNFGRPWQDESLCDYGLISLPYLDGPNLENLEGRSKNNNLKFYWLVPVTNEEVEYKKINGIEELEKRFEEKGLNYINPKRKSVV